MEFPGKSTVSLEWNGLESQQLVSKNGPESIWNFFDRNVLERGHNLVCTVWKKTWIYLINREIVDIFNDPNVLQIEWKGTKDEQSPF